MLNTMSSSKDIIKQKQILLANGLELESYAEGGIVENVSTNKIQWIRDIEPFFQATYLMVVVHLFYYFTGNLAVIIFIQHALLIMQQLKNQEIHADKQNISRVSERDFFNDKRFQIPLYTCIAAGTLTWIWSLCLMSEDVAFESFYLTAVKPKTWPQYVIFYWLFGIISGVETQCGHELIHRREYYNKILGMFANAKIFYTHFKDEHVQGHHKMLATPEDSSTSRMNESFWAYMPREIYGTHVSQWKREVTRIRKQHGFDCPLFYLVVFNKMFWYFVVHVTICVIIYLLLGWASLKHQLLWAFIGLLQQCQANYITHYGLLRNKDKRGIYDSINKYHSWNSTSGPTFFRLPRHSDHHIASFRPYQILRRFDEAPHCPLQFTICQYFAFIPPFWYWVMNPRAQAVNDFCRGKTNNSVNFTNIPERNTK